MQSPSPSEALLSTLTTLRPSLLATASALIQAASPNPPGDVSSAASVALSFLKLHIPSIEISTYTPAPGISNVVAILDSGRPGRTLVFSGHLDTYPIGDSQAWTVPPTGGEVSHDGTKLYGRGAADMKGGIAASILAMRALAEQKDTWQGKVVLALAGDEETMGSLGTAYLLEHDENVRKADAVIVGDAGSPMVVRTGEKGLLWLEVKAIGKAAHGAHVHRGKNAIDFLYDAVHQIKGLESWQVSEEGEVSEVIQAAKPVSETLSGEGEADVLSRVTVNLGTIEGGTSMNLVPDQAQARFDIRLPYGVTTKKVIDYIEDKLSTMAGISYRMIQEYDSTWTTPSEEIVKCTIDAAKSIVSQDATVNMRVGASDARLYRLKGIPTVVVGLTPYNMGGPDECCSVDELEQVAKVHAVAALQYLRRSEQAA